MKDDRLEKSLDVLPSLPTDNASNGRMSDMELCRKASMCVFAARVEMANSFYLLLCECCGTIGFAFAAMMIAKNIDAMAYIFFTRSPFQIAGLISVLFPFL